MSKHPYKAGLLIVESRRKLNLSQLDVARHFRFSSAQFISNIERGIALVPSSQISKLAKILDIPKGRLIEACIGDLELKFRAQAARYERRAR